MFPSVEASGSPDELGSTWGAKLAPTIALAVKRYRAVFRACGLRDADLARIAPEVGAAIGRHAPALAAELAAAARAAAVPVDDLFLLNARSELVALGPSAWRKECTAAAVSPGRGGPLLAQTWDWFTVAGELAFVLRARPRDAPAFVTFCEAGQLAKLGVNEAGLAVGLNFLQPPPGEDVRGGLPVHVLARAALGAGSVEGALRILHHLPRGGCANFSLVDRSGRAVCAEVRPSRVDVLEPVDGLVTHANDFEVQAPACRSRRLREVLPRTIDRAALLAALADHDPGSPEHVCNHPDEGNPISSVAVLVLEPASPKLWVAPGPPCRRHDLVPFVP